MNLTVFVSIVWALSLLYGEWLAFLVPSYWSCSWPHLSNSQVKSNEYSSDYVKVAVLTDPQLMDRTSLPLPPKSFALEAAQFYTDLFMRRAFLSSVMPFRPDVILFLGDYFDGGPFLSDEEWQESLSRFRHIFDRNILQQTKNDLVYFLPGNHDIGYSAFHSQMPEVIKRYEKEFGARNYQFRLGQVDFIAVDAQTLDGQPQGNQTSATWSFIGNVSKDTSSTSRVLLTHIPLYRPDWTPCGPHRSSKIINQRITHTARDGEILYQNYVTEKSTNDVLEMVRPVLVLSGHDHDQCTVVHRPKNGPIVEHTVGTISWQQGNLYPSFMLLSARNSTVPGGITPEAAVSAHLCFLPVQTFIYLWYLSLFVATLAVALLWPTNDILLLHWFGGIFGYIRSMIGDLGGTKEKNEDENCEYEMVWDAEGSMHLIKKTSREPTRSKETSSVERGNAVMRSTARKQSVLEKELPTQSDANVYVDLGDVAKSAPRTNKSRTKVAIRRLIRTFRIMSVVAAFNIPLYMMLMFKDWIDK